MKRFLDHAWFNFTRLFQWHRVLGIGGLCIVAYVLVFVVFGNINVGGLLPAAYRPSFQWPKLPPFLVWHDTAKPVETIYTVPTRQITRQEQAEISASSSPAKPVPPK